MYEKSIRHVEREKVEAIIGVFRSRFIDIKAVHERREAAAVLMIRLLDQISGVLYDGELESRIQQFMETYMPEHASINIFHLFQRSLDFAYAVENLADSSPDSMPVVPEMDYNQQRRWFFQLITDLDMGLEAACDTLRQVEEKRQRALCWYELHLVRSFPISLYTDEQHSQIMKYYSARLKSRKPFAEDLYSISFNFNPYQDNGHRVNVCINKAYTANEVIRIPLDILVDMLRLKPVEEMLKDAGLPIDNGQEPGLEVYNSPSRQLSR